MGSATASVSEERPQQYEPVYKHHSSHRKALAPRREQHVHVCQQRIEQAHEQLDQTLGQLRQADQSSEFRKHAATTLNNTINAHASSGHVETAELLFEHFEEHKLEVQTCTLNILIKACTVAQKMERALYWFEQFPTHHCAPDIKTYNTIIHGFVVAQDEERAFEWLDKAETAGLQSDTVTFNTLLDLYRTSPDAEKVSALEHRMAHVSRNANTYALLMGCYAAADDTASALRIYREAQRDELQGHRALVPSVLEALCAAGKCVEARAYFCQLCERGEAPVLSWFLAIMDSFSSTEQGIAWLMELRDASSLSHRPHVFDACVVSFCLRAVTTKLGAEATCEWLEHIVREDMPLDEVVFGAVIGVIAKSSLKDKSTRIETWIQVMKKKGFTITAPIWTSLMHAYGVERKKRAMLAVLESIRGTSSVDISAYSEAIAMLCKMHDVEHAWSLLRQAAAEGLELNVFCYDPILLCYVWKGDSKRVEQTFRVMAETGISLSASSWNHLKAACGPGVCKRLSAEYHVSQAQAADVRMMQRSRRNVFVPDTKIRSPPQKRRSAKTRADGDMDWRRK